SSGSGLISSPEKPVQAVILVRGSTNPLKAKVLLPADEFPRRGEDPKPVRDASGLALLAKARAEEQLKEEVGEVVLVLSALPIPKGTDPPRKLRRGTVIDLRSPLNELNSMEQLCDEENTPIAPRFYVLVARIEQETGASGAYL